MSIYLSKKIRNSLIAIFTLLLIVCAIFTFTLSPKVKGRALSGGVVLDLPQTQMEYRSLISPSDIYIDDTVTAIVQGTDSLLIHYDGEYREITTFDTLKQVKRANENTLLFSNSGVIYSLDLLTFTTQTLFSGSDPIGGNYLDINDNYLVIAFGQKASVYLIEDGQYNKVVDKSFDVADDNPIAINQNNVVFYVDSQGIKCCDVSLDSLSPTLLTTDVPVKMIANDEYLYYITLQSGNKVIKRIELVGGATQTLTVSNIDKNYHLGNINNPGSIAFRGKNLMLTDSDTAQEYRVTNDGKLEFTGFAISSGKTAYNRIGKTATEIERCNGVYAVLDNSKLSILSPVSADRYSRDNFNDFLKGTASDPDNQFIFDGTMPDSFALGNGKILLSFGHNVTSGSVKILDVESRSYSAEGFNNDYIVRDICFESGYFYILADNGQAPSMVYKVNQNATAINYSSPVLIASGFEADNLAVDVYGNFYLSNSQKIKKYSGDSVEDIPLTFTNIEKIQTDLGGGVFLLDDGALKYLYLNSTYLLEDITFTGVDKDIKSFALSFEDKSVNLLFDDNECAFVTQALPNLSISQAVVPADYKITDTNANFDTLKAYNRIDGGNVYQVNADGEYFTFENLVVNTEDYLLLNQISIDNGFISVELLVLAGQERIVIIDKSQAIEVSEKLCVEDYQSAPIELFISTAVCGYYLPMITPQSIYALNDVDLVRLSYGDQITATKKITFLQKDFYFATFTIDGKTYTGYVPKDYTVDKLSVNASYDEYIAVKVKDCVVYHESSLTNKIASLKNGTTVRLIDDSGKVRKVAYKNEVGEWCTGYISQKAIDDSAKIGVRNILIIILLAACVCGTTTYFVARRKINR